MVRINYKEKTLRGSSYFAKATKDKLPSLELPGGIFYMDGHDCQDKRPGKQVIWGSPAASLKASNAGFFTSIYRMDRINYKEKTLHGSCYFAKATKDKLPSLKLPE
jgi:hypothetical protein